MVPVPGRKRTRATASLRRPVVWVRGNDTSFSLTAADGRGVVLRRCLCCVRVLGAGVNEELAHDLAAEAVLGNHALHRVEDQLDGVLVEQRLPGRRAQSARIARVVVRELLRGLVGRQHHFVGVHDDDVVPAVDVRSEVDAVLATKQRSGDRGDPTEDEALGVNYQPLAGDLTDFWRKCAHGTSHKRLLTARTGSEGLLSLGKISVHGKSSLPISCIYTHFEPEISMKRAIRPGDPTFSVAAKSAPAPLGRRELPFQAPRGADPRRSRERSTTWTPSAPHQSWRGIGPRARHDWPPPVQRLPAVAGASRWPDATRWRLRRARSRSSRAEPPRVVRRVDVV